MDKQMNRYIGLGLEKSRVQKHLFSWGWAGPPSWSPSPGVFTDMQVPKPTLTGISMEGSPRGYDQLLTPFPAPFSRTRNGAEMSKLLIRAWFFWQPPLLRNPSRVWKTMFPSLRKLQRSQDLCVRNQDQRLNMRTKVLLASLFTGVFGALLANGDYTNIFFLLFQKQQEETDTPTEFYYLCCQVIYIFFSTCN